MDILIRMTFHGVSADRSAGRVDFSEHHHWWLGFIVSTYLTRYRLGLLIDHSNHSSRPVAIAHLGTFCVCLSVFFSLSLTESNDKPWRIHCATREQAFMLSRLDRLARETRIKSVYFASKNSSRESFCRSRTMIVSTDYCICSMQSICIRYKWQKSINSRRIFCIFHI